MQGYKPTLFCIIIACHQSQGIRVTFVDLILFLDPSKTVIIQWYLPPTTSNDTYTYNTVHDNLYPVSVCDVATAFSYLVLLNHILDNCISLCLTTVFGDTSIIVTGYQIV